MPQATNEQRIKWGGDMGVGPEKAVDFLIIRGFKLTPGFEWIKPYPSYILSNDDEEAIMFLIDEWDFGGLAP